MKMERKPLWTIILVIVLTVLAQVPSVSDWIKQVTNDHEHLTTIIEGIVGVILLIVATYKPQIKTVH